MLKDKLKSMRPIWVTRILGQNPNLKGTEKRKSEQWKSRIKFYELPSA